MDTGAKRNKLPFADRIAGRNIDPVVFALRSMYGDPFSRYQSARNRAAKIAMEAEQGLMPKTGDDQPPAA
jgi:hypothetical protein